MSIADKGAGKNIRLLDAIDSKIVDEVAGTVRDTQTGRVHDFASAQREGLVKEYSFGDFPDEQPSPQQSEQPRLERLREELEVIKRTKRQ